MQDCHVINLYFYLSKNRILHRLKYVQGALDKGKLEFDFE